MAFSPQVYGIISQIGERIYQRQAKGREKANTVVVAIGTVIAALLAGGTYFLEVNVDGAPTWLSTLVTILAMVGTLFGVSRTKNGVTRSTLDDINREVADMIDEQQRDAGHPGVPEPVAPSTTPDEDRDTAPDDRNDIADHLDSLAKRIANRAG